MKERSVMLLLAAIGAFSMRDDFKAIYGDGVAKAD